MELLQVLDFVTKYSDGLVGFAAILALLTFVFNIISWRRDTRIKSDIEISKQAKAALIRCYEALEQVPDNGVPKPSRLNWLTSARHIIRYYELKKTIKIRTYKTVLAEEEEYWRHKLYKLLDTEALAQNKYYMKVGDEVYPEGIDPRSAKIVIGFSNWPNSVKDPISSKFAKKFINNSNYESGLAGRGLKSYEETLKIAIEKLGKSE